MSLYRLYNQEGRIYKDTNCETKQAHGPRSHSSCRSWDPGPYLFSSTPVFQPPGNSAPSVLPNKKHFGDGHSKWFPLISVHHRSSQSIDWEPEFSEATIFHTHQKCLACFTLTSSWAAGRALQSHVTYSAADWLQSRPENPVFCKAGPSGDLQNMKRRHPSH